MTIWSFVQILQIFYWRYFCDFEENEFKAISYLIYSFFFMRKTPLSSTSEPSMMQIRQNMMKTRNLVNAMLDKLEARSSGAKPNTK